VRTSGFTVVSGFLYLACLIHCFKLSLAIHWLDGLINCWSNTSYVPLSIRLFPLASKILIWHTFTRSVITVYSRRGLTTMSRGKVKHSFPPLQLSTLFPPLPIDIISLPDPKCPSKEWKVKVVSGLDSILFWYTNWQTRASVWDKNESKCSKEKAYIYISKAHSFDIHKLIRLLRTYLDGNLIDIIRLD